MKKLKLLIGLFLLSICIAAVAAGCGSSSGTVVDKLPIDNNMPKPDGSETKPSVPPNTSGDGENSNGDMQEPPSPTEPNDPTEPSDPKPKPDVPPETPPEEVENIVVFVAEGFEYTVPCSAEDIAINEPAVPEKHGYRGKWQSYDLSQGGKITVRAEYELINYVITFTANKESFEITYTIFDSAVQPPQVPQRKGYNAVWEAFTLTYGEAITVNAIYTPIIYKIYFPVGRVLFRSIPLPTAKLTCRTCRIRRATSANGVTESLPSVRICMRKRFILPFPLPPISFSTGS